MSCASQSDFRARLNYTLHHKNSTAHHCLLENWAELLGKLISFLGPVTIADNAKQMYIRFVATVSFLTYLFIKQLLSAGALIDLMAL